MTRPPAILLRENKYPAFTFHTVLSAAAQSFLAGTANTLAHGYVMEMPRRKTNPLLSRLLSVIFKFSIPVWRTFWAQRSSARKTRHSSTTTLHRPRSPIEPGELTTTSRCGSPCRWRSQLISLLVHSSPRAWIGSRPSARSSWATSSCSFQCC